MKTEKSGMLSAAEVKAQREQGENVMLVCAYDDQQNFERIGIEGSMSFPEFQKKQAELTKGSKVVFYCDCPHDELAVMKTEEMQKQGFSNAAAMDGGINAWANA